MPDFTISSRGLLRRCAVAALLLLLSTGLVLAQAKKHGMPRGLKHEGRQQIDRMEEMWRDAALQADGAKVASLLAEDYMGISPNGTLQNKAQTVDALSSGRLHFTAMDFSDRKVRFYGTTAVVISQATVKGSMPDGELSGTFRYTRVYVRDDKGNWKVVTFEASSLR